MSIRIVTHAYAIQFPLYAVFLRSQLSSLVIQPIESVPVKITVCCLEEGEDPEIETVLEDFLDLQFHGVLSTHRMTREKLFRRAVGRNEVALQSMEDLIWFCDADYYMGQGCFDAIWEQWCSFPDPKPIFIWPRTTWIHLNHDVGDEFIEASYSERGLIDPTEDQTKFKRMRYDFAIGGLQIMNGEHARTHGYLNGTKWTDPITDWDGPVTTAEDVKFRKVCKSIGDGHDAAIDVPELYRLRHSETGLSKRGQPAGKRVEWEKTKAGRKKLRDERQTK